MEASIAKQTCQRILETYGGKVANETTRRMMEDPALNKLQRYLQFIAKNWRDLTPALMNLSCRAVGGAYEETEEIAVAFSYINLGFTMWDDIIDGAKSKSFKDTFFGQFGQEATIIMGGLLSAKAFTIISESKINEQKRAILSQTIWRLWCQIADIELSTNPSRKQGRMSSADKLQKMEAEAIVLGTITRIGAIVGNASEAQIKRLEKYGKYIGIILALRQDLEVSVNLTLEIPEKIKNKRLPYCVLWAREHSLLVREDLESLERLEVITDKSLREFVAHLLNTGILGHIKELTEGYKERGKKELTYLANNDAIDTLGVFISAQSLMLRDGFFDI